jgi:thioredoxin reductase (NADPH)
MAAQKLIVYGAPWCPDCRRSKRFLSEMRIPYEWVDIDQEPEAGEYVSRLNGGRRIIPTIVFEDGSFLAEPTNAQLAAKLGLVLKAERTFYDLIIIGGGPAGLAAAIYAAREGIDALVIEESGLGGQAGITERIDNYPGFPEGIKGADLVERFIAQARRYEVELLTGVRVARLARDDDGRLRVVTEPGDEYRASAVIVATGSHYKRLNVPGEDQLIGAGIHFCATCDGPFYRGSERLLVIGSGNSALEEALFLTQFTDRVIILGQKNELSASPLLIEKAKGHPKIDIQLNSSVVEFRGGKRVESVVVKDTRTGELREIHPWGVFIFIGLTPNTKCLGEDVEKDDRGFIKTDATFQTNIPGVFAAGDVRSGSTKQLASAIGEGVTALLMVRNYLRERGELGRHNVAAV